MFKSYVLEVVAITKLLANPFTQMAVFITETLIRKRFGENQQRKKRIRLTVQSCPLTAESFVKRTKLQ